MAKLISLKVEVGFSTQRVDEKSDQSQANDCRNRGKSQT